MGVRGHAARRLQSDPAGHGPVGGRDVVAHGEFGNILANPVEQFVDFAKPLKIRYAKLTATHAVKGEAAFNPAHKWAVMFYQ